MIVGDVNATAIVFRSPLNPDRHFYVVRGESMETLEFLNRYPGDSFPAESEFKQATGLNMEDGYSKLFFLISPGGMYDPPVAVVRASNIAEAIDIFVDECTWSHVDESNYTPEELNELCDHGELSFGPSGQLYDAANMQGWQVFPYRIECD